MIAGNRQFILTGAPGAGKTVVLRQLETMGQAVVEEAATDVIALAQAKGVAEPHLDPAFIDTIVTLQEQRRRLSASAAPITFHDRSPICTLALARHLGFPVSDVLSRALRTIEREKFYTRRVFSFATLVSSSIPKPGGSVSRIPGGSSRSTRRFTGSWVTSSSLSSPPASKTARGGSSTSLR